MRVRVHAGACGRARVREQNGERACAEEGIRASRERASELGASARRYKHMGGMLLQHCPVLKHRPNAPEGDNHIVACSDILQ
jgi:hypothetical protein